MKDWSKRLFSTVLATTLLVSTVQPLFVLATEGDDTGLCEHHVTHENCGYVEAVAGADCTHEHDDSCYTVKCAHVHGDCGYMPAVEGVDCDHKHDNACGYTAPVAEVECTCQQEGHTTECAYAPAIPEGQCTHVHGECSYVEAKEEIPCGHDCAADEACNEKVLNCTHAHSESCGYVEAVEGKACEFVCETCAAEEAAAAAVAEVKTLIEALPEVEAVQAMALEEKKAAYAQTQAAYEAYNNLTEEQKAQLPDPEEIFKPYFDYFNTLVVSGDNKIAEGNCGSNLTWTLDDAGVLTICGTGAMDDYQSYSATGTNPGWSDYSSQVNTVIVEEGVTSVGNYAFDCLAYNVLKSVELPTSLTRIGKYAFYGNEKLADITIGKNVTYVGDGAFENCKTLNTVNINAKNIIDINWGTGVFVGTGAITVNIGPEVTRIPTGAFWSGNSALNINIKKINFDDNSVLKEIGNVAFPDYQGTGILTLPDSIEKIGANAFIGAAGLTGVLLPAQLKTIGLQAFAECSGLTDITFFEKLESIGESAFNSCNALTQIRFMGNSPEFESNVFVGAVATAYYPKDNPTWTSDVMQNYGGTISWEPYNTDTINKVITGNCGRGLTWNLVRRTGILTIMGSGSMADYPDDNVPWKDEIQNIKSVVVKEGATNIGIAAFRNCSNLISVSLPTTINSIGNVAFDNCPRLTDVSIQPGIETIGWGVFQNCSSLKSINLPEGIISIGTFAFRGCSNLNTIVLPDSISTIDVGLFENCSELHAVGWPEGLSSISDRAFASCSDLKSIHIPEGVRKIGCNTFENCSSLSSIHLPASLAYIEEDAFKNCSNLVDIYITDISAWVNACDEFKCNPLSYDGNSKNLYLNGELVKDVVVSDIELVGDIPCVGAEAFYECDSLQSICLGDSITEIEKFAFYGCDSLISVNLGKGVTRIQYHAFEDCTKLKSINLPMSVTILDSQIFTGTGIYEIIFNGDAPQFSIDTFWEMEATAYYPADNKTWTTEILQNYGGDITWKPIGTAGTYGDTFQWSFDESNGTLTISGEGILYAGSSDDFPWEIYNDQIKVVVIEDGVTVLGEKMFITSQNLTHVTLPDTVTAISYDAFSNCTNLQQVNIPSSVESIHGSAFENCTNLTDVNIPDSVQVIKEEAFRNCSSLKEVTIPGSVTEISYATFADCSSLTEINISAGVTAICYDAFSNCTSLQQVHIPGSVESIYERAFENCTDLTELTIADGVQTIKEEAFRNCSSLTEVAIPESVTEIAYATFANCSSLKEINIPSSVTAITYGAFDSCTGLQEVTISGTVTNISYEAFSNCTGLTTVKLSVDPAGITEGAFKNCDNLTTLVLSENLKNMGTQALRTFPNVTTIRFTGNAPAFASDAFQGITATAYYPADKANWTSDILQNYGGNITWIAMNSGGSGSGNNPTLPPASGDDETDTGTVGGTVAPVVPTTPPTETPRDLIVIEKNDMSAAIQAAGNAGHAEVEISAENKDGDMVSLPVESMKEIADADLSLSITTKEATISFDTKALDAITQQADSKELYLKYQEIKEETLNNSQKKAIENQLSDNKGQKHVLTFTVELISDSKKIHDFRGGTATIKIPFKIPAGTKAEDFVVFYLNSNGEIERYETTYDGEYLIVRLNHFSEYAVVYDPDVEETVPAESTADVSEAEIQEADEAKAPPVAEEQPDAVNPFLFIAPAGVMLIALLIVVLIFLRRKKS